MIDPPDLPDSFDSTDPADQLSGVVKDLRSVTDKTHADRVFDAVVDRLGIADAPANIGRLQVESRIGSGAMGVVFLARDTELDRPVAVKLLRSSYSGAIGKVRLQREAKALARLRHPNAVAIYELGEHEDQAFVAMEYVDGGNLRQWLKARRRTTREIVDIFVQAGRGLAAAHAAGIVHRDFKLENVLVGEDNRAQVADFGLARTPGDESTAVDESTQDESLKPLSSLTRTGQILGTPAYMAPEVFDAQPASAASDQFSFCVALYEALFGARPFSGETVFELARAVSEGRMEEGPDKRYVARSIRRAVRRGLSHDPHQRWPRVATLLQELERDPWRRAKIVAVGGVATLAVAAATIPWSEAPVCSDTGQRLAGVWDAERKAVVRSAFAALDLRSSAAIVTKLERRLDSYAEQWQAAAADACEATLERQEQSNAAFDLRMQCLDRRREDLDALVNVLEQADARVANRAESAASSLVPVGPCADVDALTALQPLPDDPDERAEVERVRAELAQVRALREAGLSQAAAKRLEAVSPAVTATGYEPLIADATLHKATVEAVAGKPEDAQASLRKAFSLAQSSGDHETAVWAAVIGIHVAANGLRDTKQAREWAWLAAPLVERAGADARILGAHHNNLGNLEMVAGNEAAAARSFENARDAWVELLGPTNVRVAYTQANLAVAYRRLGRLDDALALQRDSERILTELYGEGHPAIADTVNSVGVTLLALGHLDEAEIEFKRALRLSDMGHNPNNPASGHPLNNLGEVFARQHRFAEAIASYDLALARWREAYGDKHAFIGAALGGRGLSELAKGDTNGGTPALRDAFEMAGPGGGEDLAQLAFALAGTLATTQPPRLERARALARVAADHWAVVDDEERRAEVERWLAAHQAPIE